MPKLNLSRFAGDWLQGITFSVIFQGSIKNNNQISDEQKLQCPKGFMQGRTAEIQDYLPISDQNFSETLDILVSRFGKLRLIVDIHIEYLLDSKPNT